MTCNHDHATHHNACDCREAHFAAIEADRDALAARVEALEGVARDAVLAMPVLATMLKKAKLGNGANVANRMHDAARKALGEG